MKFIRKFETELDVFENDVKLGNGKMLSHYEKINDLEYPFIVFEDNDGKLWVLDKDDVVGKSFDEFKELYKDSGFTEKELKELYQIGLKYF